MSTYVLNQLAANPVALRIIPPSGGAHSYVGCFEETPYTVSLSTDNFQHYDIHLYAENSNSAPYQQPRNKWSHLIPQWRFTDLSGNYIESISPTTTSFISGGNGYIGQAQFYYVDDRQSNIPVKLWAVADYSRFAVQFDTRTPLANVSGFSNSLVVDNQEHTVYGMQPTRLKVTRNAINNMFPFYWKNMNIPVFFTLHGPVSTANSLSASIDPILFDIPLTGQDDIIFSRSISGIPFNTQSWHPTSYTQAFSAVDEDDFTIGGYVYSTVSLSSESLGTVITAGDFTVSLLSSISGESSPFDILTFDDYDIRRFNESWDATNVMTDMIFVPHIKNNQTFWNGYISGVWGGKETEQGKAFGRQAYERIANFVPAHSDIETCGIDPLYSIANEADVPIDDYGFSFPPELRRIMDIISVNQQKLWGTRCTCNQNIEHEYKTYVSAGQTFDIERLCERCGHEHPGNRGNLFDGETYIVSAGEKFIIRDKYLDDKYSLIVPPPSCFTELLSGVDPCSGALSVETCLTSYPLSAAYWWLLPGVFSTTPNYDDFIFSAIGRFCFYDFVDVRCGTQIEGIINWDDKYTTLNENLSTSLDWYGSDQAIEKIINYFLHKGLGLIDE